MPANPVAFVQTRASRGLQCQPSEGDAWAPIRQYWRHPTSENREILREALSPAGLRSQYTDGVPDPNVIAPEGYTLDAAMIDRPGNMDIQLDLFLDLRNNVKLYPAFREYFRKSRPPLLAIWGKHDSFFVAPGAKAYLRDNPNATVQFLDTGHFALDVQEITTAMREFLAKLPPSSLFASR
jgi:pimeloyl-ACP methyl ester carboxylesterase